MIKKFLSRTILLLSLCLTSTSLSFAASTEEMITIYIIAESNQVPTDSAGLIFFSDHVEEVNNCNIQEIGTNKYLVSFQISKEQLNSSETFNAILFNDSGTPSFGVMRSPEAATYDGILEQCPMKDPSQALKANQDFAVYRRIIKLKSDRVESEKQIFLNALDPKTEKNLRILGEKLGILQNADFSTLKENPLELVYELSKIEEALKIYLTNSYNK